MQKIATQQCCSDASHGESHEFASSVFRMLHRHVEHMDDEQWRLVAISTSDMSSSVMKTEPDVLVKVKTVSKLKKTSRRARRLALGPARSLKELNGEKRERQIWNDFNQTVTFGERLLACFGTRVGPRNLHLDFRNVNCIAVHKTSESKVTTNTHNVTLRSAMGYAAVGSSGELLNVCSMHLFSNGWCT